eukprot:12682875-Heterocapsa_arctica.AAC.1
MGHDVSVEIAIADEKGRGIIYFVTPHTERGRSAALLPDGTLEPAPPEYYANGRKESSTLHSEKVRLVKETHDQNSKRNTLELIAHKPLPPRSGYEQQLPGKTRTYTFSQLLSLPNSVPAGR